MLQFSCRFAFLSTIFVFQTGHLKQR